MSYHTVLAGVMMPLPLWLASASVGDRWQTGGWGSVKVFLKLENWLSFLDW